MKGLYAHVKGLYARLQPCRPGMGPGARGSCGLSCCRCPGGRGWCRWLGFLAQRELGARCRVDELRKEVDRVQAELADVEWECKEWVIACSRVGGVLALVDESGQDPARAVGTAPAAEEQTGRTPQVPVWREGLAWSVVSVDCRRILGRSRTGPGSIKGR